MSTQEFKTLSYWREKAEYNGAAWEACLQRLRRAEDEVIGLRKLCADLQAKAAMIGEAGDEDVKGLRDGDSVQ